MGTSTHFRMPRSLDVAHSDTHPRRLWIGRGPLFALVLILACAAAFFLAASHARQERQALASDHRPRMAAVRRELTGLQTAAAEAERLVEVRSRILPALERRIELVTEEIARPSARRKDSSSACELRESSSKSSDRTRTSSPSN